MRNDARSVLNKKMWKSQTFNKVSKNLDVKRAHGVVDARRVLNSKKGKFNGGFRSSLRNKPFIPEQKIKFSADIKTQRQSKQVQLSNDGNIWITSNSKSTETAQGRKRTASRSVPASSSQRAPKWEPTAVDMDDLEHIGIGDLIDMESLPSAAVTSKDRPQHSFTPRSSLASNILTFQNTMVADQVAGMSRQQVVKVYVTNLQASVSKQDILELFGDIGPIKSVNMMFTDTAVVEFLNLADASTACEIYHNRLLDGKPMQCHLKNTDIPYQPVSKRLADRFQEFSSVSSAATSFALNPRSRCNPRDVKFTVKL